MKHLFWMILLILYYNLNASDEFSIEPRNATRNIKRITSGFASRKCNKYSLCSIFPSEIIMSILMDRDISLQDYLNFTLTHSAHAEITFTYSYLHMKIPQQIPFILQRLMNNIFQNRDFIISQEKEEVKEELAYSAAKSFVANYFPNEEAVKSFVEFRLMNEEHSQKNVGNLFAIYEYFLTFIEDSLEYKYFKTRKKY